MSDNRLKCLILTLANCIVYSKVYIFTEKNAIVRSIWDLSHYILAAITIVGIGRLIDFKAKSKSNIAKWVLIVILILGTILCAFICSSELSEVTKQYFFISEIVMVVLALVIYHRLSIDCEINIKEATKETNNVESREHNILEKKISEREDVGKSKLNIYGSNVFYYLYNSDASLKNKRQVRAALWIVICVISISFVCFVLPLILKCIKVEREYIIYSYFIALLIALCSILIKNILYYESKFKTIVITIIEFLGIGIGCILDGYWNVYIGQIEMSSKSIYFGPYLVMGLGIVPFIVFAQKIIENYKMIFSNKNE